jgi:GNAT superfamily N-acetyltransferase
LGIQWIFLEISVMSDLSIKIRPLTLSDISMAMALKDAEGWNQTPQDWELFLKTNPSLCLGAIVAEKLVGTVTAISFENKVAWISMMLVHRGFRRRGISKVLLKEIIHRLEGCASIKLDATPAGYPVYESLGFREEFALARYILDTKLLKIARAEGAGLTPISTTHLEEVVKWDTPNFGADRGTILAYLHSQAKHLAWFVKKPKSLGGYIMGRQGTRFTQIGPLVAQDIEEAKALLLKAVSQVNEGQVALDVCMHQKNLVELVENLGFVKQRDLFRMYLKGNPHPGKPENYYLVAGPELG